MKGLRRGDQKLIVEITGLSESTVKKTLAGTRRNQQVLDAATALIKGRQALIDGLKKTGE